MSRYNWNLPSMALAPIAWGTTYLVTTRFLPPDRPLLAGTLRALPIGLLMLLLLRRLPQGQWWVRILVLGTLNIGAFFSLLFVAAYRLPGGVAAVMGACQPLIAALLAWQLLAERPTAPTIAAALAGVAGVALILLSPSARLDPLGLLASLGATACMAAGAVLTRLWGRPAPLLVFTAWQLTAGGLLLAILTVLFEWPLPGLTLRNAAGAAYLGIIGTGLAYALWFRGIERAGTAANFLALLSPVVAVILGFAVLHQGLNLVQLAGVVLALGSVTVGQRFARPTQAQQTRT